jgi:hypothetical protein
LSEWTQFGFFFHALSHATMENRSGRRNLKIGPIIACFSRYEQIFDLNYQKRSIESNEAKTAQIPPIRDLPLNI